MTHLKYVLLFFGILLFSSLSCNNNEGENNNNDSITTLNNNEGFENQDFTCPLELPYAGTGQSFIYDKFYPIGWSKDGKLAYITEPADEGSGLYWFEIIIFDIVNNTVSWSWKPSEMDEGSVKKVWDENYDLFAKHLNEAEIVQLKNFELKQPKTSYKGNDYEMILETKTETDHDFGFDIIKELEMRLVSPELGEKKFASQKIDELSYIVNAFIPGYLLCPYDDRIVVICKKERPGYEGPPNVVFFDLIGTDLIRGFKKEKEG